MLALVLDMGQQKDRTDKTLNPEPSDYITISQPIFYVFINPIIGLSRAVLTTRYCIENKKLNSQYFLIYHRAIIFILSFCKGALNGFFFFVTRFDQYYKCCQFKFTSKNHFRMLRNYVQSVMTRYFTSFSYGRGK